MKLMGTQNTFPATHVSGMSCFTFFFMSSQPPPFRSTTDENVMLICGAASTQLPSILYTIAYALRKSSDPDPSRCSRKHLLQQQEDAVIHGASNKETGDAKVDRLSFVPNLNYTRCCVPWLVWVQNLLANPVSRKHGRRYEPHVTEEIPRSCFEKAHHNHKTQMAE